MRYFISIAILIIAGFFLLPKDAAVANPPVPPMNEVTSVQNDGNGCITYQEPHAVGKDMLPVIIVRCEK